MMSENIKKLRELALKLPFDPYGPDHEESYMVDGGKCLIKGLLKTKDVGVLDSYYDPGTKFPLHLHNVSEWLVIYAGVT